MKATVKMKIGDRIINGEYEPIKIPEQMTTYQIYMKRGNRLYLKNPTFKGYIEDDIIKDFPKIPKNATAEINEQTMTMVINIHNQKQ